VRAQRLVSRREPPELPTVPSVAFWRRLAVSQGYPAHPGAVVSRAREAARQARRWARPAPLAQPAGPLPREAQAAWDAPVLRPGAGHVVAARPAPRGVAEALPRAGLQAWVQPGAPRREARGAAVLRDVAALRPAGRQAVRDVVVAVLRRVAQHAAAARLWAGLPSARLSAAVSVFRQDRVRLEALVRRRSVRFARATACPRNTSPSKPLKQAARDEGFSWWCESPGKVLSDVRILSSRRLRRTDQQPVVRPDCGRR
jgi:hypothetical protein